MIKKKSFRVSYEVRSFVNVYVDAHDEDEALELANEKINGEELDAYNTEILMNAELGDGEVDEA